MRNDRHRQSGFTIIEVMIAMTLGLFIVAALSSVFVYRSRNHAQDERVSRVTDEIRFAMAQLTTDLEMAGYWAQKHNPASIDIDDNLDDRGDCGAAGTDWVFEDRTPLQLLDDATGSTANAMFSCIAAGDVMPNTDILAIKRVDGIESRIEGTASDDFEGRSENRVYFRTNGVEALLYKAVSDGATPPGFVEPTVAPGVPTPYNEWQYEPVIYFIRNWTINNGDGLPSLCRKELRGGNPPGFQTQCLASGVESLQFEFGLDPDGDDSVDYYTAAPTVAQLAQAISARVLVLAGATEEDPHYTNRKTYLLSNEGAYTPNDGYYRKLLTATVRLHNPASLRQLSGN